jgi:cytochrome P450
MDVVADFAVPLPVTVIGEFFGLSADESLRCYGWLHAGADSLGLVPTPAQVSRADEATGALAAYFAELIVRRRIERGRDIVSRLIDAQEREPDFTDAEMIANCILFFGAGFETTVALIGTIARTLMTHPDVWDRLRTEPALIPPAVDEVLRYDPPLRHFARQAREDVMIAGKRIRRGESVMVLIGAVNRDPARFPDPERFDVDRRDSRSLTFGHGIHVCAGRSLARLEGQVALGVLTSRLPSLRPGLEPAVWRPNSPFRALDALPVVW